MIAAAAFYAYMKEREAIRLRRSAGESWPWTDDPILREYSFTNVKRRHDRTTQRFIKLLYAKHRNDHPELVLLNAAIARYFGTPEFVEAIGGWQNEFRPISIADMAIKRLEDGLPVFTGAYIITNGGYTGPKPIIVAQFIDALWSKREAIVDIANTTKCWQPAVEYMMEHVFGMGGSGFMAKEIILDVRLTNAFWKGGRPRDMNTWTPIGPGTMRGAARIIGDNRRVGKHNKQVRASPEDTLRICKELFALQEQYWPAENVTLELTDIAFQLCEFDKYERARKGEGRPRKRYQHQESR